MYFYVQCQEIDHIRPIQGVIPSCMARPLDVKIDF